MNILMTGSTGAVGSELLGRLLLEGHTVLALARSKGGQSAEERVRAVLTAAGFKPSAGRLEVIEGDITKQLCFVQAEGFAKLYAFGIDLMVHSAANVKMDESKAEEVCQANIDGTFNAVELANIIGCGRFHYISTAYVENGGSNVYEKSKSQAEVIVAESGLDFVISRISIVVGRSADSYISGLSNGYYGYFIPLVMAANDLRRWANLTSDAAVCLPATLKVVEGGKLNIIPLDWVAEMLKIISETLHDEGIPKGSKGLVINVTNPDPPETRRMITETLAALNISGVEFGEDNRIAFAASKMTQLLFDRVVAVFEPYVGKEICFNDGALQQYLGDQYYEPPKFTAETFARLITYAAEKNFGRKK